MKMKEVGVFVCLVIAFLSETSRAEEILTSKICQKEGFFRHTSNCKKFYRCVDWSHEGNRFSIFLFDCPSGTTFDENLQICNFPWKSRPCNQNKPTQTLSDQQQLGSIPPPPILGPKPPNLISPSTPTVQKPPSFVTQRPQELITTTGQVEANQGLVPLPQLPPEIVDADETDSPVLLPLPFPGGIGLPPIHGGSFPPGLPHIPSLMMGQGSNMAGSQHFTQGGQTSQSMNGITSSGNQPLIDNHNEGSMSNPVNIQDGFIISTGSHFQTEHQGGQPSLNPSNQGSGAIESGSTIQMGSESGQSVSNLGTGPNQSLQIDSGLSIGSESNQQLSKPEAAMESNSPNRPGTSSSSPESGGLPFGSMTPTVGGTSVLGQTTTTGNPFLPISGNISEIQSGSMMVQFNSSSVGAGISGPVKFEVMEGSIFNCPAPGFYPNEDNCIDFFVCLEILPGILLADQVYRCPKRYLFDDVTRRCQREHKVNCQKFSLEGPSAFAKETVLVVLEQFLEQFFNTPLNYGGNTSKPRNA